MCKIVHEKIKSPCSSSKDVPLYFSIHLNVKSESLLINNVMSGFGVLCGMHHCSSVGP